MLIHETQSIKSIVSNHCHDVDGFIQKLTVFIDLLTQWHATHNLISNNELPYLVERHILDSLQLLPYIPKDIPIYDFGSGAGFPGLILAMTAMYNITLIESINKKSAFLIKCVNELHIHNNAKVVAERLENVYTTIPNSSPIISRAVCSLSDMLEISRKYKNYKKSSLWITLKSSNIESEILEAQKKHKFKITVHPYNIGKRNGNIVIMQCDY